MALPFATVLQHVPQPNGIFKIGSKLLPLPHCCHCLHILNLRKSASARRKCAAASAAPSYGNHSTTVAAHAVYHACLGLLMPEEIALALAQRHRPFATTVNESLALQVITADELPLSCPCRSADARRDCVGAGAAPPPPCSCTGAVNHPECRGR